SDTSGDPIYTLNPRRLSDRYATDVMNRWECKLVSAEDVTYQFLICHTTLVPRNTAPGTGRTVPFGASAYSILSDGKEASSNVKLMFGATPDSTAEPPAPRTNEREPAADRRPAATPEARPWQTPASQVRLVDIGENEFRLRFNVDAWKGKIGQAQLI